MPNRVIRQSDKEQKTQAQDMHKWQRKSGTEVEKASLNRHKGAKVTRHRWK